MNPHYQRLMAKRGYLKSAAPDEQFWRCLCCRDTGLITVDNVTRYLKPYNADLWEETTLLGCAAAAVECSNKKCGAGVIAVPSPDNPEVSTQQPRFSYGVHHIRPDICQWIHEQEYQRLQAEQPAPLRPAIAQSITTIGQPMPAAAAESHPLEQTETPTEPDEVAGLHSGDRVVVADSQSDRNGQDGRLIGFAWQASAWGAVVEFGDGAIDVFNPLFLEVDVNAA